METALSCFEALASKLQGRGLAGPGSTQSQDLELKNLRDLTLKQKGEIYNLQVRLDTMQRTHAQLASRTDQLQEECNNATNALLKERKKWREL